MQTRVGLLSKDLGLLLCVVGILVSITGVQLVATYGDFNGDLQVNISWNVNYTSPETPESLSLSTNLTTWFQLAFNTTNYTAKIKITSFQEMNGIVKANFNIVNNGQTVSADELLNSLNGLNAKTSLEGYYAIFNISLTGIFPTSTSISLSVTSLFTSSTMMSVVLSSTTPNMEILPIHPISTPSKIEMSSTTMLLDVSMLSSIATSFEMLQSTIPYVSLSTTSAGTSTILMSTVPISTIPIEHISSEVATSFSTTLSALSTSTVLSISPTSANLSTIMKTSYADTPIDFSIDGNSLAIVNTFIVPTYLLLTTYTTLPVSSFVEYHSTVSTLTAVTTLPMVTLPTSSAYSIVYGPSSSILLSSKSVATFSILSSPLTKTFEIITMSPSSKDVNQPASTVFFSQPYATFSTISSSFSLFVYVANTSVIATSSASKSETEQSSSAVVLSNTQTSSMIPISSKHVSITTSSIITTYIVSTSIDQSDMVTSATIKTVSKLSEDASSFGSSSLDALMSLSFKSSIWSSSLMRTSETTISSVLMATSVTQVFPIVNTSILSSFSAVLTSIDVSSSAISIMPTSTVDVTSAVTRTTTAVTTSLSKPAVETLSMPTSLVGYTLSLVSLAYSSSTSLLVLPSFVLTESTVMHEFTPTTSLLIPTSTFTFPGTQISKTPTTSFDSTTSFPKPNITELLNSPSTELTSTLSHPLLSVTIESVTPTAAATFVLNVSTSSVNTLVSSASSHSATSVIEPSSSESISNVRVSTVPSISITQTSIVTTLIEPSSSLQAQSTDIVPSSAYVTFTSPSSQKTTTVTTSSSPTVQILQVALTLIIKDGATWSASLTNTSSSDYMSLRKDVNIQILDVIQSSSLKNIFVGVTSITFRQGSVIVDSVLKFNKGQEQNIAANVTKSFVDAVGDGTKLGNFTIDKTSIVAKIVPETGTQPTSTRALPGWGIAVIVCVGAVLLFSIVLFYMLYRRHQVIHKYTLAEEPDDDTKYTQNLASTSSSSSSKYAFENKMIISDEELEQHVEIKNAAELDTHSELDLKGYQTFKCDIPETFFMETKRTTPF